MKKTLSLILAIIMAVTYLPATYIEASAAGDDWSYYISESATGGVTLDGYYGSGSEITVPGMIDGHKVVAIGDSLFASRTGLKAVTIPDGVISIGDYAFDRCLSLVNIILPQSVKKIGVAAFSECSLLENITIPSGVEVLRQYTFDGCNRMKEITIPQSVKVIENSALPSSLTKINYGSTFEDWNKIRITGNDISSAVLYFSDGTVFSPSDWSLTEVSGGVAITAYNGNETDLVIPSLINGKKIVSISENAFKNHTLLRSVVIPATVSEIGESAFSDCNLISFTLPESVSVISKNLLSGNKTLKEIYLPLSLSEVGEGAFSGCANNQKIYYNGTQSQFNSVKIYNTADFAANNAEVIFSDMSVLKSDYSFTILSDKTLKLDAYSGSDKEVIIPCVLYGYTVSSLGDSLFSGKNITSVSIPSTVTTIGEKAFCNCKSLGSVCIPGSIKKTGTSAFEGCTALKKAEFMNGFEELGEKAFYGCGSLETISLPVSLKTIKNTALSGCSALSAVYYMGTQSQLSKVSGYSAVSPKAVYTNASGDYNYIVINNEAYLTSYKGGSASLNLPEIIDNIPVTGIFSGCFEGNKTIISCFMPNTIRSVGNRAFYGCEAMKTVRFSTSLETIGESAFENCTSFWSGKNGTSILIPKTVNTIENKAFCNSGINGITLPENKDFTIIKSGVFSYCKELTTVRFYSGVSKVTDAFEACQKLSDIDCSAMTSDALHNISFDVNAVRSISKAKVHLRGGEIINLTEYVFEFDDTAARFVDYKGGAETFTVLPEYFGFAVTEIPSGAFSSLSNLKAVIISEGIISIGKDSFKNCASLSGITFPTTLKTIGKNAFSGCSLSKIYYNGNISDFSRNVSVGSGVSLPPVSKWSHTHYFVSDASTAVAATCTKDGYEAGSKCISCGEILRGEVIPALGHNERRIQAKEATCTENGNTEGLICTRCGEVFTESVPIKATGHDFYEMIYTAVSPRCEESGHKADQKCSVCGERKSGEVLPALGHKYVEITSTAKTATCTESGRTADAKCSVCNKIKSGSEIPALGHTAVSLAAKPATTSADGKTEGSKCSVCGTVITKQKTVKKIDTVALSAESFTDNGKVQKPTVSVKDSSGKDIASSNYTVKYSNSSSKAIGSYTVTVTFKGAYSGKSTLTYKIVPKQVTGVKVKTFKTTSLTLTWTAVSGAKYYKVEQSSDGKTWKSVLIVTTNSAEVKSLKAGTKYQFRVTALDSSKKISGKASSVLKTGTLTAAPTVTLKSSKSKTVEASWKKVTGASKYIVYKSTDNKKWTKAGETTKLTYTLSKLTGGKKIYVKAVAVNAYGKNSADSKAINITVKK